MSNKMIESEARGGGTNYELHAKLQSLNRPLPFAGNAPLEAAILAYF